MHTTELEKIYIFGAKFSTNLRKINSQLGQNLLPTWAKFSTNLGKI